MKKQSIFFFFLFCSTLTFAQSSLDSLRLVLPVGHTKSIKSVCLSYDNNLLATIGDDNSIIVWGFLSSKQIQQILIPEIISKVYFINNNQNLVIIGISKVFIYSLQKGIQEKIIDLNGAISSSQMSYDEKYVIIGMNNGSLKIIDFKTTEKIYVFKDHTESVNQIALTKDDKTLISIGDSTVNVYDFKKKIRTKVVTLSLYERQGIFKGGNLIDISVSPNNETAVITSLSDTIVVLSLLNNFETIMLPSIVRVNANLVNYNDKLVLTSNEFFARIIDRKTGDIIYESKNNLSKLLYSSFSPSGKLLVSLFDNNNIQIWDNVNESLIKIFKTQLWGFKSLFFDQKEEYSAAAHQNKV